MKSVNLIRNVRFYVWLHLIQPTWLLDYNVVPRLLHVSDIFIGFKFVFVVMLLKDSSVS